MCMWTLSKPLNRCVYSQGREKEMEFPKDILLFHSLCMTGTKFLGCVGILSSRASVTKVSAHDHSVLILFLFFPKIEKLWRGILQQL